MTLISYYKYNSRVVGLSEFFLLLNFTMMLDLLASFTRLTKHGNGIMPLGDTHHIKEMIKWMKRKWTENNKLLEAKLQTPTPPSA